MTLILDDTVKLDPIKAKRIDSLDLLRGIAILGILLMNTQSFSMPQTAYVYPPFYGSMEGWNRIVWIILHVFADMKFITTFSILFGAGIVMQSQRVAARGISPAKIHYRRMAILLFLGLVHAYGFWVGDILTTYAICGLVLFPFRKLPAGILFVLGMVFIVLPMFFTYASVMQWDWKWITDLQTWGNEQMKERALAGFELEAYRGGWWHQMSHRAYSAGINQLVWIPIEWFWRCGGAMLIGMGLMKARFFHGEWNKESYVMLAAVLIPTGWAITGTGVLHNEGWSWEWNKFEYTGLMFNYWGSLVAAMGYISAGILLARVAADRKWVSNLLGPVRSIGKTALSNYFLQTILCTTWFYGHGFKRFGDYSRVELLGVVGVVWGIQLIVSPIWTKFIGQGPLEKAWHGLVYLGLGERRNEDRKDIASGGCGSGGVVVVAEPDPGSGPARID